MNYRLDCRHYTGYKPCGCSPLCADGCTAYEPRGRHILILKLGAMGDVLRTTPLLRALRRLHSPCYITWLTLPESEPLLRHNPFVDRLLVWGLDAALQVQAEKFDLLLNFEKEGRALALDALTHAGGKRGFALSPAGTLGIHNDASSYALRLGVDDELKFRSNLKTMPEILFEMAEVPYGREEYVLELSPGAKAFGRRFAESHGLAAEKRPIVGLNTGCGAVFATKQWPLENFARLVALLHERGGCRVLLLGGERERTMNAELLRRAPAGALLETGCGNSLDEFSGLVDLCDLVVSSDSLAMHLAIGLRKEVVALLGSTSVAEIELYGRGEILTSGRDCSPCFRKSCDHKPNCMDDLAAKPVAEAIGRRLKDKG